MPIDYACSDAHPCANPNHNHSAIYCSDTSPARHWSRDLPAYGADNCAGCGGTVPCGCDDECKRDVQGNRWIICGAPGDGPCYCDTMVRATPSK